MAVPSLIMQTSYAELLERTAAAAFSDAFREAGSFVCKTVKGRRYWYFQVGPAKLASNDMLALKRPSYLNGSNITSAPGMTNGKGEPSFQRSCVHSASLALSHK